MLLSRTAIILSHLCNIITLNPPRFMGVDYLRRLAIDSAWSRGYRLVVMRGRLERTGRGGFGYSSIAAQGSTGVA